MAGMGLQDDSQSADGQLTLGLQLIQQSYNRRVEELTREVSASMLDTCPAGDSGAGPTHALGEYRWNIGSAWHSTTSSRRHRRGRSSASPTSAVRSFKGSWVRKPRRQRSSQKQEMWPCIKLQHSKSMRLSSRASRKTSPTCFRSWIHSYSRQLCHMFVQCDRMQSRQNSLHSLPCTVTSMHSPAKLLISARYLPIGTRAPILSSSPAPHTLTFAPAACPLDRTIDLRSPNRGV